MEDDGPPLDFDDLRPVTFGEFNAFFVEKGAEKPCPDCGEVDWVIPTRFGPEAQHDRPVHVGTLPNVDGSMFTAKYSAYCANCGHTKLYDVGVVRDWRDQHG